MGGVERCVGCGAITGFEGEGDVGGPIVPDLRHAWLIRVTGSHGGGSGRVGHRHEIGSVAGLVCGFGDHEGEGIADKTNPLPRQQRPRRDLCVGSKNVVAHFTGRIEGISEAREMAEAVGGDVGAGQHRDNTSSRQCQ